LTEWKGVNDGGMGRRTNHGKPRGEKLKGGESVLGWKDWRGGDRGD